MSPSVVNKANTSQRTYLIFSPEEYTPTIWDGIIMETTVFSLSLSFTTQYFLEGSRESMMIMMTYLLLT